MSFELGDFLSMMPHTVTVQRVLRDGQGVIQRDAEGNALIDPTVYTYRARVVGKILSLRKGDREEPTVVFDMYLGARVLADGTFQSVGSDLVTMEDKITLDGDPAWVDNTPAIFAVARVTDEDGHHHIKVQGGWVYHRQGQ